MHPNFETIQNLSTDELRRIPKEHILNSIQEVLDSDNDTSAAFEFAFGEFTTILSINEINDMVCQRLLPPLKNMFDEIYTLTESSNDEVFSQSESITGQILTIFQIIMELAENIHKKLDEKDMYFLSDVECISLNILHFLCKSTSRDFLYRQDEVKSFLDAMQISVSRILVSTKLQLKPSVDELKHCRKVLQGLIQLGNQQSQRDDLKSMANTWKHLSKLSADFRMVYQSISTELINLQDDLFDWVAFYVQIICELITKNIHKILECSKTPKEIMAITKITSFYLKLLENLAKEYGQDDFRGHVDFIKLYEMISQSFEKFENNEIKNYLSLLNNGFDTVLSHVYNSGIFSTELMCNCRNNHIRVCLTVIKLLIKSSDTKNHWYLNSTDTSKNIFHHLLFVCVPKEMIKLCVNEDLYDEVINLASVLLILAAQNNEANELMEQILIEATLIDDAYRMPILIHIWFQFLRYMSNESRLKYCELWLELNKNMSTMPNNLSNVLVRKLLKHTFDMMSEPGKSQFIREKVKNDWAVLDLLNYGNGGTNGEVSKRSQNAQQIVNKLKDVIGKLNPKSDIVTNNECIELINAFAYFQFPVPRHLLNILNDPQLTSVLYDALLRSKTRNIGVLVSSILRILLWQQQFCKNNSIQIDYSDSREVRKFYALESISLAQLARNRVNNDFPSILNTLQDTDDLIQARIEKTIRNLKTNIHQNGTLPDQINSEHFNQILKTKRNFGCTSFDSCLDQTAVFKRGFEQIIHDVKKLENAYDNNSQLNLRKYEPEISYLSQFFNRLQNDIS